MVMDARFIERCRELNRQGRWHRMFDGDDRTGGVWDHGGRGEHLSIGWETPVLGGNGDTFFRPGRGGSAPTESFWLPRVEQMVELTVALSGRSAGAVLTAVAARVSAGSDIDNAALDELVGALPPRMLGTPESLAVGPDPLAEHNRRVGEAALAEGIRAHQDGDPWRARSRFWRAGLSGFPEVTERAARHAALAGRSLPKYGSRRVRAASTVYREAVREQGDLVGAAREGMAIQNAQRAEVAGLR
jgi:hypothetical protein